MAQVMATTSICGTNLATHYAYGRDRLSQIRCKISGVTSSNYAVAPEQIQTLKVSKHTQKMRIKKIVCLMKYENLWSNNFSSSTVSTAFTAALHCGLYSWGKNGRTTQALGKTSCLAKAQYSICVHTIQ